MRRSPVRFWQEAREEPPEISDFRGFCRFHRQRAGPRHPLHFQPFPSQQKALLIALFASLGGFVTAAFSRAGAVTGSQGRQPQRRQIGCRRDRRRPGSPRPHRCLQQPAPSATASSGAAQRLQHTSRHGSAAAPQRQDTPRGYPGRQEARAGPRKIKNFRGSFCVQPLAPRAKG
jgi:hypothetical protein